MGCSYTAYGCQIHWTNHSLERVRERFADQGQTQIPNRRIAKAASNAEIGDEFRIPMMLATLVCKLQADADVVIVTVLFTV